MVVERIEEKATRQKGEWKSESACAEKEVIEERRFPSGAGLVLDYP